MTCAAAGIVTGVGEVQGVEEVILGNVATGVSTDVVRHSNSQSAMPRACLHSVFSAIEAAN